MLTHLLDTLFLGFRIVQGTDLFHPILGISLGTTNPCRLNPLVHTLCGSLTQIGVAVRQCLQDRDPICHRFDCHNTEALVC